MGILGNFIRKKKEEAEQKKQFEEGCKAVGEQIRKKEQETETALSAENLTPETMNGKKRSYHYKDVSIYVTWQYSGRYGKTLSDLGMKRGSEVSLILDPQSDDPECVRVCFNDVCIGNMRTSRMRSMVYQWNEKGLPIMAVANSVGGEYKLLLEIAFYGYVRKQKS
jgi:hypothetical protein